MEIGTKFYVAEFDSCSDKKTRDAAFARTEQLNGVTLSRKETHEETNNGVGKTHTYVRKVVALTAN